MVEEEEGNNPLDGMPPVEGIPLLGGTPEGLRTARRRPAAAVGRVNTLDRVPVPDLVVGQYMAVVLRSVVPPLSFAHPPL